MQAEKGDSDAVKIVNDVMKRTAAGARKDEQRLLEAQTQRQTDLEELQKQQQRDLGAELDFELHQDLKQVDDAVEADKRLVSIVLHSTTRMLRVEC